MVQNVQLQQMQGAAHGDNRTGSPIRSLFISLLPTGIAIWCRWPFLTLSEMRKILRWKLVERVVAWYELEDDLQLRAAWKHWRRRDLEFSSRV